MEGALPIATLAVTIWVMRFLLPRAVREDNSLALASALISMAIAVWLWFIAGFVRAGGVLGTLEDLHTCPGTSCAAAFSGDEEQGSNARADD
jgi:hypothetical protein